MNENYKSLRKTIGWSTAIVIGLILLFVGCVIWLNNDSNEENRRAYERGYSSPAIVGADIAMIDAGARIKCHSMGLDQDGCPQSDEDTTRRVMATLMTQTIEKNGPAWQGNAYLPDTIRAMNHRFYDLTHHLQDNPCSPIPYGYATDQILEQLREGRFIYRCGQGWSITAEWLEDLDKPELLSPNTPRDHDPTITQLQEVVVPLEVEGTPVFMPTLTRDASEVRRVAEEHARLATWLPPTRTSTERQIQKAAEQGHCDQLLRNQLVFQRGASTANQIQGIVIQIQAQRDDCISGIWNPVVNDNNRTGTNGCWESEAATERINSPKVGNLEVPDGLFDSQDPTSSVMRQSGRDSENSIIVYWWDIPRRTPADGAVCWMYVSRLNSWSKN